MQDHLTIALAQINTTVGDIRGNVRLIIDHVLQAARQGADLVVFPEMALTGYPAEDLLFKDVFKQAAADGIQQIAAALADCPAAALVGGYHCEGQDRYNATYLIEQGKIKHIQCKHVLPNYGVFDEKRLFRKGEPPEPILWRGHRLGVLICEDMWQAELSKHLAARGAELLIVQNASPYEMGKAGQRKQVVLDAVRDTGLPLIYLNLVGGQDELVFDGRSFIVNANGGDAARLPAFTEALQLTHWQKQGQGWHCTDHPTVTTQDDLTTMYQAMVLGLKDYVQKNGFNGVVIGLSGGIDSGLTAAVAVDALGADKVHGLIMPSPYTSQESMEDANALADALGIRTDTISIEPAMHAFNEMLAPVFSGQEADTTEENIQARIRGNLLMAFSNKRGYMLLTTGNKSEMSVGYSTLYGDMCGGYSVLKDVYKMTVFALSRWRNAYRGELPLLKGQVCYDLRFHENDKEEGSRPDSALSASHREAQERVAGDIIPKRMITKPPSAELKPDQKDEDTLPPYAILDDILHGLIEERLSIADVAAKGHDRELVDKVARMIYVAEYKRRQSPPGVKITGMSFGRDRRYPITNKWIWQRG